MLHEVEIINGEPTFKVPLSEILGELKDGGALQVLTPNEYHTTKQRNWYRGICLPKLSEWNGDTVDEWDLRLKAMCNGNELLKQEKILIKPGVVVVRLTIRDVCKSKMTAFIKNILSKSIEMEWDVVPPDPDLIDKNKEREAEDGHN